MHRSLCVNLLFLLCPEVPRRVMHRAMRVAHARAHVTKTCLSNRIALNVLCACVLPLPSQFQMSRFPVFAQQCHVDQISPSSSVLFPEWRTGAEWSTKLLPKNFVTRARFCLVFCCFLGFVCSMTKWFQTTVVRWPSLMKAMQPDVFVCLFLFRFEYQCCTYCLQIVLKAKLTRSAKTASFGKSWGFCGCQFGFFVLHLFCFSQYETMEVFCGEQKCLACFTLDA